MTMDIYQRTVRADSSPPISVDGFRDHPATAAMHSLISKKPPKPVKRSFDVAFLMAPDDLSKKRSENRLDPKKTYKFSSTNHFVDSHQYQLNPLSLTINPTSEKLSPDADSKDSAFIVRSAFTKVNNSLALERSIPRTPPVAISPSSVSSTTSNRSAVSPDLTYQDSLSPQPFVPARSPVQLLNKQYSPMSSPNLPYFVASPLLKESKGVEDKRKYSPEFLDSDKKKYPSPTSKHHHNFQYHPESVAMPYAGFPMSGFPFTPSLPAATTSVPIFPTAAALLPTSLAALTLPAQNICAKCNMHFRMTSDLVYHMRSHHKNENGPVDPYKRRRDQDKLKCPVCNESFRERHHLTRHMTAHQDKEDEENASVKGEFVDAK